MFHFEIDVLRFLEGLRSDLLVRIFEGITMLAEETLMILLVVALWFAFDKKLAQKILFVTVASMGVNGILKNFVRLPRPWTTGKVTCVRPETATGYSFPSGHTQSFTTWTLASALHYKRFWLTLSVSILSLLVGFSRLLLGAHYPSDVLVGLLLGAGIAILGSLLYDRVERKERLYLALAILLTPFAILFLFDADPHFADLYKVCGMAWGLAAAFPFEERFAPLSYDVPWWKKLLRVLIGVALAFAIKEGIKLLDVFGILQISLLLGAFRYFVLVFFLGGLCPWIFRKCRL